jgi:hypothetical protein
LQKITPVKQIKKEYQMKRTMKQIGLSMLLLAGMATVSFGFEYENTPRNLQKLFETILVANAKGDYATAAKLTRDLIPDGERIMRGMRSGVSMEIFKKYVKTCNAVRENADDKKVAGLLTRKPERSQIYLYGVITEQIALNQKGSIVWKEFPGGAVKAAKTILKPKTWFYEIERVEPGKSRGFKYHLIFWDGQKWCMLGRVWSVLR